MMRKKLAALFAVVALVVAALAGTALAGGAPVAEPDLEGTGALKAVGDGIAQVRGKGILKVNGSGVLIIEDLAGDAVVRTDGWGAGEISGPNRRVYFGKGEAYVKGSRVVVTVSGANIELKAIGHGQARFEGTGRVWVRGFEKVWTAAGTEVELPN